MFLKKKKNTVENIDNITIQKSDIDQNQIIKECKKEEIEQVINKQGDYLLWNMSDLEARNLCKQRIDTMEHWARRLLDESFKETYGKDYFDIDVADGQPLFKTSIKKQVEGRMKENPGRFSRKVDALVIEDLEYFFCRDDLYKELFKNVFEPFYSGAQEVRSVLNRVSIVRNKIAHGNHLSQHELEQGVCYSNDFVTVFIDYYKKRGKEKEYNVPTFLAIKDSFGRCLTREDSSYSWEVYDWSFINESTIENTQIHLRSGDTYRLELEIDSSFPVDFYEIEWNVVDGSYNSLAKGKGNIIEFTVDDKCVSYSPQIYVKLTTKRSWHRFANINCDDHLKISMSEVFPPIEDKYI